jgi:hypothetical protein
MPFIAALLVYTPSLASRLPSPHPAGSTMAATAAPCIGSVAEYCSDHGAGLGQRTGGKCPTYDESVKRLKTHCTPPGEQPGALPPPQKVFADHCVGVYRSLRWRERTLLFGSDEYFDANGQLIAAYVISDALGS